MTIRKQSASVPASTTGVSPASLNRKAIALAIGSAFAVPQMAYAGPLGGVVQAGQTNTGVVTGNTTTITQSSQRAVVQWNSFNTVRGESVVVNFLQSGSAAMYSVLSPVIYGGNLSANG